MSFHKQIKFTLPSKHINDDTQTNYIPREEKTDTIVQRMRDYDTQTLLQRECRPSTTIARSLTNGYASLGFYCTALYDERFDQLSTPKELYSDLQPGVICNLYETEFTISTILAHHSHEEKETFTYEIDKNCLSFINSIENGKLSIESFKYLFKKDPECSHWIDGVLICKIIDNREETPKISFVKLELGSDIFVSEDFRSNFDSEKAKLESERQALLLKNPIVCVDPSPDVARIQSVADNRQKMWQASESHEKALRQNQQRLKSRLTPEEKKLYAINDELRKDASVTVPHFTQFRAKLDINPSLEQKIAAAVPLT